MTRTEEIELEIRLQAVRFYPKCVALFELPSMIYAQIMEDNKIRIKPYRISFDRVKKVVTTMTESELKGGFRNE